MKTIFVQFFTLLAAALGFYPSEKWFLPASFNAKSWLGGYKSRPQYWDLDIDEDRPKPILLDLKIKGFSIKLYYLRAKSSTSKVVSVCYHGQTKAVGALYTEFWSLLGNDTDLILVNFFGYGTIDQDRSQPLSTAAAATFDELLNVIPAAIQKQIFEPDVLDWTHFDPRMVRRNDRILEVKPLDEDATSSLPKTFTDYKIVPFGRSFGASLALKHEKKWPVCLYMPYLGRQNVTGPRFLRPLVQWALERLPFPEAKFDDALSGERRSLVIIAKDDQVVGKPDPEVLSDLQSKGRLYTINGDHGALPDPGCKIIVRDFMAEMGQEQSTRPH
ncbi:uncharacterized protein PV07_12655 [Cladophialophora immunda]|uniref:AB hydrolase-1 domain-containing protein n=1 Tax=Cladophialophora immunda TaxID=569365 RepID=A0A0D2BSB7_9EURO|nr:uncharacterized protein PV07_12655 [Cladophialophora immunda]KIW21938.1 hypothetical protein PV07_12655 [Cladophialophora immunda]